MSAAAIFFAGYCIALTIFFIALPISMRNAIKEEDSEEGREP